MEQVRWCMTQSGAVPLQTPGRIEAPANAVTPEDVEEASANAEADASENKEAAESATPAE
ncbi:MAG TPA: hypothetical protein DF715_02650 [Oceanicaulis sp.]|nr:hypothetical protein [Oceanicaulis sp.]